MVTIIGCFLAGTAFANPADEARAAMEQLEAAAAQLDSAESGRDRVAALTQTVYAFEDGLSAIRTGLRAAVQEEEQISADLAAKEAEVARLLGVIQIMGQRPAPQLLLHPSGPTGAARSGMILSDVTPALQAEVAVLRDALAEVSALRILQQDAAERLREGLVGVQEARAALARAISDREPLPKRFTEDSVKTAILIGASETLEAFADGLAEIAENETAADLPAAGSLLGALEQPVRGTLLRRFEEADAAGISRPGLIMATRPDALVSAPAPGTVRFQGELLDYGNVMILEPAQDVLVVLAGLEEVYVATGDVVTTGTPIGLMGRAEETSSTERSQTLYIEVRHEQTTVDPEEWFAFETN
ncbi:MAG: peptidoglycan DD-metalloendopeptidase family protein [Pseudomonadota bacterium]